MRLCAPCDGNLVKHIRQIRSTSGLAGEVSAAGFVVSGRLCIGNRCCEGRKVRRVVGLRPGAKRRGKPRRAARVIIAATERPNFSAICGGASPANHKLRKTSSCSAQLPTTPACGGDAAGTVSAARLWRSSIGTIQNPIVRP